MKSENVNCLLHTLYDIQLLHIKRSEAKNGAHTKVKEF